MKLVVSTNPAHYEAFMQNSCGDPSGFDPLDRAFSADYPMGKLYLLFGGEMAEHYDNITVLPMLEGLKRLPEILQYEE